MEIFRSLHLSKPKRIFEWLYALPIFFFGLFYHSLAGFYDFITQAISMGLWKQWLAATVPYLEGVHILEIGNGPGHLLKMLTEGNSQVYGLEQSQQMLRRAELRLRSKGYPARLVCGLAQNIPFKSSAFDHVVSTFPAEFITHPHTLSDIQRVLKPNGKLIILRFAWLSDQRWPYKATAWLFRIVGEAPCNNQPLPVEELAAPFQAAGFSVTVEQLDLGHSGLVLICCQDVY